MMKIVFWWLTFGLATVALSEVLSLSRSFTLGIGESHPYRLLLWLLILVLTALYLAYDTYVKAKKEGKLVRANRFFDSVYQYQEKASL
jgi:thymidylate kinase